MNTISHHISHTRFTTEAHSENNIFKLLYNKVVKMLNKESHTLGEYILLYALDFFGLLIFTLLMEWFVL